MLGYYHSEAVLESGFNVILTDIDKKKLNETTGKLKKKFPNANIISKICDITNELNIKKLQQNLKKIKFILAV